MSSQCLCVFSPDTPVTKCLRLTEEPKLPKSVCLCVFVIDCDLSMVSSLTETTGPLRLFCFFAQCGLCYITEFILSQSPTSVSDDLTLGLELATFLLDRPCGNVITPQPSRRGSSNRTHSRVKKRIRQAVEFSLFILVRDNIKRASFSEHSPTPAPLGSPVSFCTCVLGTSA